MKHISEIFKFIKKDYKDNLTTMDKISELGGYRYVLGQSFGTIDSGITEYILYQTNDPVYVIVNCYHKGSKHKGIYLFKYVEYDGFKKVKKWLLK